MSQKFADQAAGAFMTIQVSISRWTGIAQLKQGARDAANDADANPDATRMYINILGSSHALLKAVNAAYAAIRTYLYEYTLPFCQSEGQQQKRGDRLMPVCRVPEIITKLGELERTAIDALDDFLPEYDRLVQIAMSNDMGNWRNEIHPPSADEVRSKFAIRISAPKAIPSCDMERFASLPAGMAQEISDANAAELITQLDGAKSAAMKQAEDQMSTLVKQLSTGKRLHDSLVTNARRCARMLRDMTEGYDNDPRLIALADLIDEKIVSYSKTPGVINTAELWNEFPWRKGEARRAAETVHKGLKEIAASKPAPVAPNKPAASNVVKGGLLADLLD